MKLSPVVRLDIVRLDRNSGSSLLQVETNILYWQEEKTNCSLEAMSIVDLTPVDLSLCAQAPCYEFAAVATLNLLGFPPQSHMYLNLNLAILISRSVSLDPRAQECANHLQPGIVARDCHLARAQASVHLVQNIQNGCVRRAILKIAWRWIHWM